MFGYAAAGTLIIVHYREHFHALFLISSLLRDFSYILHYTFPGSEHAAGKPDAAGLRVAFKELAARNARDDDGFVRIFHCKIKRKIMSFCAPSHSNPWGIFDF